MSVLAAGLAGHKGDKPREKRGSGIMDVIGNGLACSWNLDKVLWPDWCTSGLVSCSWRYRILTDPLSPWFSDCSSSLVQIVGELSS